MVTAARRFASTAAGARRSAMTKLRTFKRALRYISHFGVKAGSNAARLLRAQPGGLVRLQLPELAHPLWARPGTSDVETFEEVFVARQYELPFANFSPRHILDLGANVGFA